MLWPNVRPHTNLTCRTVTHPHTFLEPWEMIRKCMFIVGCLSSVYCLSTVSTQCSDNLLTIFSKNYIRLEVSHSILNSQHFHNTHTYL